MVFKKLFKAGVVIAAITSGAKWITSIRKQRRDPEPFPASQARILDNPIARRQAERVVAMLDLSQGMRVLDIGAGIGRFSIPIAKVVEPTGEVVSVDIQEEMLDILAKRAANAGATNIQTIQAAAGDGAVEPASFDRALLVSVLGEIPHDRRLDALNEIREGLRPGGILYVVETLGDPHYQTRTAVFDQGKRAGFTAGKSRGIRLGHVTELVREG